MSCETCELLAALVVNVTLISTATNEELWRSNERTRDVFINGPITSADTRKCASLCDINILLI